MQEIKTAKQLEAAWNELREEILSRPLFTDNSPKAKAERKKRCENNIEEFARTYFPEYVRKESAKFHREWEKIRRIEDEPILLQAFRGSGKSTFFTLLDPIHEIAYGNRNFMIFSSYNEEKSGVFTGRILLELMFNQRLQNDFGTFILPNQHPGIKNFTAHVPGSGGKKIGVRAVSIGQDPRGFVHGPNRPDYVRLDDIQSRKRAKSRKFVRETIEWVTQDLIPALAENYSALNSYSRCEIGAVKFPFLMQKIPIFGDTLHPPKLCPPKITLSLSSVPTKIALASPQALSPRKSPPLPPSSVPTQIAPCSPKSSVPTQIAPAPPKLCPRKSPLLSKALPPRESPPPPSSSVPQKIALAPPKLCPHENHICSPQKLCPPTKIALLPQKALSPTRIVLAPTKTSAPPTSVPQKIEKIYTALYGYVKSVQKFIQNHKKSQGRRANPFLGRLRCVCKKGHAKACVDKCHSRLAPGRGLHSGPGRIFVKLRVKFSVFQRAIAIKILSVNAPLSLARKNKRLLRQSAFQTGQN